MPALFKGWLYDCGLMADSEIPPPVARPALVRAISRFDLTAAVVNGVICSAIFGLPGGVAALTGSWSPIAYLLAGLGVLTIVLSFAEVASRFRDGGGPYLYAREAFGPFVGFQAGWLTFWIRVTAVAANLNVFVEYGSQLVPAMGTPWGRVGTMTGVLALVTAVNLRGVRQATWTVDLFTVAKLLPLVLLIVLGLGHLSPEVLATQTVASPDWTQAILLLVFAYGGFEAPLIPAGEAKDPRRDTGFALLTALAIIAVVYTLVQWVVVGLVPQVATVKAPLAAAFRVLIGPWGVTLAGLTAMVSIYGYTTGTVLQSPRVLLAMAERGELPRIWSRIHPVYRTPDAAILTYSALVLVLAVYGSFTWNATLSAVVRLLTYGATCVALPVLRRRWPGDQPGFRLPAGGLISLLGASFCLWLLLTRTFSQAWVLAGLVLAGSGLFLVADKRRRSAGP